MMKFLYVCFTFLFVSNVWAQERMVSGKVTAQEDGSALPGVNVVLKGTSTGVVTDFDGNYQLSVPATGGTLIFSFIGFATQEIAIGQRAVIDVQLGMDVQQLTEVVVTAQGIERERKALGYASTTISANDIADKPEPDLARALQGRTPGLQILNSSGIAGSGSKINIRGISSVSGNTQPLWVVDGVPINTGNNDSNKDYRDGQIGPNRFFDLDPNNVESISILRGLSATTLYGSLGRNGVILVTTKTGSQDKNVRKFEASVSQSLFVTEAILPEFQNKWGNGYDGDYGEFFSNWGSVFNGQSPVISGGGTPRHPYYEWRNVFPEFPEFAMASGYIPEAQPNNVSDMFRKGTSSNTSVSLGGSSEFGNLNFAYSHLDEDGFVEHNNVQRDNFSLGGNATLTDKFRISSTFNYVRSEFASPPTGAGGGNNSFGGPSIFANLYFTPRNLDITHWPYQHPVTGENVYYRNTNGITNPRWVLNNALQTSLTNRFFSNINFNYEVTDWLKLSYRLGLDTYGEKQTYQVQKGSVGYGSEAALIGTGLYRTIDVNNTILDHSVIANIQKDLNEDLELNGIVGLSARTDEFVQTGLESSQQVVFGLMEHRNFANSTSRDFRGNNLNTRNRRSWYGVYFDAGLGYKNYLYLNVTGRNDWSTTLEKENNSLFYPGVSASFIPTAAFPNFGTGVLDFLKVRAGYGTSANFPDPYNTRATLPITAAYQMDALGNVPVQGQNRRLANHNLKPELQTELEFGLEAQLLENLAKLDLSYYSRSAKDQILGRQLDPSTGYTETLINAGEISNKGVELGLTVTPVRGSVVWNLRGNYTRNVSKVVSLPEGSKEILISGSSSLGNFAIEGEPFNVIKGQKVQRNAAGQPLTDADNDYVITPDLYIIGDPNPDWLGSFITDVTWKGITFAFQVDYVQGGDMYSTSNAALIGRGVSKDLENFDPGLPLVLPGVKETDESVVNDGILTTAGVFYTQSILEGPVHDRAIYDATRVRLREVSLSYNIPQSLTSKLSIRSANISLVGNNMWFKSLNSPKYTHVDFDRTAFGTGNGAGFEYLGGPSARRYGVNLRLTF
ncbi:MAG: SusC/RagA family TonB-linked outer membrane protein [Cyclobacteriaceae bacterium]|nr:SusC/RagA family TonB-linked outer membrane protein [Cyclobacteriaceae bacterium]MCB0500738.1 SusC/RagA family TonB-linked outer membrane protein [Cyclobacteriaceae bacterium]MCB9238172.1 SusC/RagA family TonB-linked outer membrane protein [Flammeovirgaceae bacterium]MCO5272968.1 SusC/RagA family TonB-linked outer membrane protein [Cyclobacteriaceae bacterium]MCW5901504.1 SusC/RagA family TonB-linked outer membrane protein [Cyclobacteriaceae bacterium]